MADDPDMDETEVVTLKRAPSTRLVLTTAEVNTAARTAAARARTTNDAIVNVAEVIGEMLYVSPFALFGVVVRQTSPNVRFVWCSTTDSILAIQLEACGLLGEPCG